MIALLQRVSEASVTVDAGRVAGIDRGLLVFIGVVQGDAEPQAERLLERLLAYRVFPDAEGRMNLDLKQVQGGLLLVPQFTLVADTSKGNRPSFTPAASPEEVRGCSGICACRRLPGMRPCPRGCSALTCRWPS